MMPAAVAFVLIAAAVVAAGLVALTVIWVLEDQRAKCRLEDLETAGVIRRIDRPKFQGHIVDADLPPSDRAREAQRHADEAGA